MDKSPSCFFVSDLHGSYDRYHKLFEEIRRDLPQAVFIGGDILPGQHHLLTDSEQEGNFIEHFLQKKFAELKEEIKEAYPRIFIILGNDDSRVKKKKSSKPKNRESGNIFITKGRNSRAIPSTAIHISLLLHSCSKIGKSMMFHVTSIRDRFHPRRVFAPSISNGKVPLLGISRVQMLD